MDATNVLDFVVAIVLVLTEGGTSCIGRTQVFMRCANSKKMGNWGRILGVGRENLQNQP